jgi:hypothetical protein
MKIFIPSLNLAVWSGTLGIVQLYMTNLCLLQMSISIESSCVLDAELSHTSRLESLLMQIIKTDCLHAIHPV